MKEKNNTTLIIDYSALNNEQDESIFISIIKDYIKCTRNFPKFITNNKAILDENKIATVLCGTISIGDDKIVFECKTDIIECLIVDLEKDSEQIKRFFKYDYLANAYDKNMTWRHHVLKQIDIKICPYCNRNYIDKYVKQDEIHEKTSADLDHFYSQNRYPYLSLSLYNFVPSCKVCNSLFKGDNVDSIELLYPYDDCFGDDCNFKITGNFANVYIDNNYDFDIILHTLEYSNNKDKIEKNKEIFCLESIYQNHKDDAKDLLNKKYLMVDSYVNSLKDSFGIDINVEELVFGVYSEKDDLSKHISKFKRDIYNQK